MQVLHDITIDVLRPRRTVIKVVQEDSVRKIRLTLLKGNQNYDVSSGLDGATLLKFVEFKKSDGHGGMYDTTSTGETAVELEDQSVGNVWLVALDGQCFTAPGWTQINVRFETEDGKRIHTFRIMVDVEPTASSDTESTDWGELNSIGDMKAAITAMFEETMSVEAKQALLNLLAHVAYTDEHGQDYYDELETELFRTAGIVSISAVFNQGSAIIYNTDDLDDLRQYLTVTAIYEDLSEREVDGYTLSGTLTVGTSEITVSYGGKTTTFDVSVSEIWSLSYPSDRFPIIRVKRSQTAYNGSNGIQPAVGNANSQDRRCFLFTVGEAGTQVIYEDGTQIQIDGKTCYPIPVPSTATSVTVSVLPATTYIGVAIYKYNNGAWSRPVNAGWTAGSSTQSFTASENVFLTINSKPASGNFSSSNEPTVTITFS